MFVDPVSTRVVDRVNDPDHRPWDWNAISMEDVQVDFPEALVLLDWQVPELARAERAKFVVLGKLELEMYVGERLVRARWHAGPQVWVRYSCGVSSHPRREPRDYGKDRCLTCEQDYVGHPFEYPYTRPGDRICGEHARAAAWMARTRAIAAE